MIIDTLRYLNFRELSIHQKINYKSHGVCRDNYMKNICFAEVGIKVKYITNLNLIRNTKNKPTVFVKTGKFWTEVPQDNLKHYTTVQILNMMVHISDTTWCRFIDYLAVNPTCRLYGGYRPIGGI